MGKRSNFKRRPQDAYDTPPEAVAPLLPHLPDDLSYWEPCAGSGVLMTALRMGVVGGVRVWASDLVPRAPHIVALDALETVVSSDVDLIITNPPWTREILHPMIIHFSNMRPTWLLFDADWMHTKQATPYLKRCHKIVSVGRVKWIPDSPHTGKDNAAWYLFTADETGRTEFFGRA